MTTAGLLFPVGLALVGTLTGLAWRIPAVERVDARLMHHINQALWPSLLDRYFGWLRSAGTTLFFLLVLVLVAFVRPRWAAGLVVAAIAAELITITLKRMVRRARPFTVDAGVVVRLPRLPIDPSFPSADAMRAAFLSALTMAGRMLPAWVFWLAFGLAVVIGLGRVRSGAHYPLDVWTGLVIGLSAAIAWTTTL
jgi:membrane-associated phospholipid phosphatase